MQTMNDTGWSNILLASVLLIWAGLALGGNLIAAPAKFQADGLGLADLLRVGRAQFTWLGWAEAVLLALSVLLILITRHLGAGLAVLPILIFMAEQLQLQPALEARTDLIISGQSVPESAGHLWFVILEVAKVLTLILAAAVTLTFLRK